MAPKVRFERPIEPFALIKRGSCRNWVFENDRANRIFGKQKSGAVRVCRVLVGCDQIVLDTPEPNLWLGTRCLRSVFALRSTLNRGKRWQILVRFGVLGEAI